MNPKLALLKKDLLVSRKRLMIPIWITLLIYTLILISVMVSLFFKSDETIPFLTFFQMSIENELSDYQQLTAFFFNYIIALVAGFLLIISIASLTSDCLNPDASSNHELFHRCQPISTMQVCYSRLICYAGGSWVVYLSIAILNFLLFNVTIAIMLRDILSWNFFYASAGMIYAVLPMIVVSFIFTASGMFFSALFKDNSTLKGTGLIFILSIVPALVNSLYGWQIPGLYTYFLNVLKLATNIPLSSFDSMNFTLPSFLTIFDLNMLTHVFFGVFVFLAATYVYSLRQIKK